MQVFARTCRRRLSYHQPLLCKYVHLQNYTFIIYNESKAVHQRLFTENSLNERICFESEICIVTLHVFFLVNVITI